jgi:hypothetical protein
MNNYKIICKQSLKIKKNKKPNRENSTLRVPRAVTQVDGLPPAQVIAVVVCIRNHTARLEASPYDT